MNNLKRGTAQGITQHKRFAYAHPNFCFAKTSFMLGTLYESQQKERGAKIWKS